MCVCLGARYGCLIEGYLLYDSGSEGRTASVTRCLMRWYTPTTYYFFCFNWGEIFCLCLFFVFLFFIPCSLKKEKNKKKKKLLLSFYVLSDFMINDVYVL